MDHIIHTQFLDISISHVSRANEVQQSLSDHFWNEILPEINKLFDELCKENEVLLIQQLEIDLGRILYRDVIKKNIDSSWIKQLREQILQFVLPSQVKKQEIIQKITLPQHLLEQWIFYMKNGYMPWSIIELPKQWEMNILEQLASDYNSIQLFKEAATSNSQIIIRIIRQHDESFLVSLLETILAESQKQLVQLINDLTNLISVIASSSVLIRPQKFIIKESIWLLLFERSIAKPEEVKAYQWIPDFLKKATELKWIDLYQKKSINKDLIQIIDQLNISFEFKDAIHSEINNIIKSETIKRNEEDKLIQFLPSDLKSKEFENNSEPNSERILSGDMKNNETESITQSRQLNINETEEQEFYFSHLGLILVHPFIILLFKRLGFTEAGQFISKKARLKAIYLLHYIATGSIDAKEFELAIPKLFCGELLINVLDPCPEFKTEELEEAETMLEGSIAQWKPGLFSITALRHNFLQRSGFWKTKNDQIILQLEKSSIDIILKTYPVPWNLSIVKFPWLKKLIVVEWV